MREQRVVVAIVKRGIDEFLVTHNVQWHGYAFPMHAVSGDERILPADAIAAVEHDLGLRLPHATAEELDHLGCCGVSGRTGEEAYYHYSVFAVDPGQKLKLPAASGAERPPLFVRYADLAAGGGVTWSSSAMVRDFVENQQVALAVIARPGIAETEYLLVKHAGYQGYFFPVKRVKSEVRPDRRAAWSVRHDLGYHGPAEVTLKTTVPDVHYSHRFFNTRSYQFHVCEVCLPGLDIHLPYNRLERCLLERGKQFVWIPAGELAWHGLPAHEGRCHGQDARATATSPLGLSPTMAAVAPAVVQAIGQQTIPLPLRTSEAGMALIERTVDGQTQWLAQFNDAWHAYSLVGGHREQRESFRECTVREVEEELGLKPSDCPVAAVAAHRLQYLAFSQSAKSLTSYAMDLFSAQPTAEGLSKIAANAKNRFLTEREILRLGADDGRNVSETVLSVLAQSGKLCCAAPV